MTLPTLTKTYEFDVNRTGGTGGSDSPNRSLFAIKEALTGGLYSSNPNGNLTTAKWTVTRSCTSLDSNTQDYDVWVSSSKVYWDTGVSWAVLTSPAGHQILLSTGAQNNEYYMQVAVSPGGLFTGGSHTANPTATDSTYTVGAWYYWFIYGTTPKGTVVHTIASTDGKVVYVLGFHENILHLLWVFQVLEDQVATGLGPSIWSRTFGGSSGSEAIWERFSYRYDNNSYSTVRTATLAIDAYPSYEAIKDTPVHVAEVVNFPVGLDNDSEWMSPVGLWTLSGGYQGKLGNVTDLWWGRDGVGTTGNYGTYLPATGALRKFVQVGNLWFPWDGHSTLRTAY